jgi:hypothetical protein
VERQLTVAPPPLPEPLHWLIVTGSAGVCVEAVTSQRTRSVAPPPLPELLHWLTVAPVVLPAGEHCTVGSGPPPAPEPLHWSIVAAEAVDAPVMLFVMRAVQVTTPPPPLPEPLHWFTVVVTSAKLVVLAGVHVGAPAGPEHCWTVTVELPTPVARSSVLVMVTSQRTSWPPTFAIPLHCSTAEAAAAAVPVGSSPRASTTEVTSSRACRSRRARPVRATWKEQALMAIRSQQADGRGVRAGTAQGRSGRTVSRPSQ